MKKSNIYYQARMEAAKRDKAFASRERAAEAIHVSAVALQDYENGLTTPPCDVVASMCVAYRMPALRNRHMQAACPLMQEGVATTSELTKAALSWVTTLSGAECVGREFAMLALDGRIDTNEVAAAKAVRQKAVELTRVMQETITAIDTALCEGGGD